MSDADGEAIISKTRSGSRRDGSPNNGIHSPISLHRRPWALALVLVALLAGGFILRISLQHHPVSSEIAQQIAIPAYIDPSIDLSDWNRLVQSPNGSVGIAVANVLNGPGSQPDSLWAQVIHKAHNRHITVVGYVDTGYLGTTGQQTKTGQTSGSSWVDQVEADINSWYDFYGASIGGIFFDQVPDSCGPSTDSNAFADLYREMTAYVTAHHPGAMTVLNPGTAVPHCYENVADVLVTFEGSYPDYLKNSISDSSSYQPLSWAPSNPEKIWHIIYAVSSTNDVRRVIDLAKSRDAGFVYVTNANLPNPYDSLPLSHYWSDEQHDARMK